MDTSREQEFLAAYDAHADGIYRHCFFRVYSRARAEELTQEVFSRVWQYYAEGKRVDNLKAFLYRVATNLVIDESRRKKEGSLDALLEVSESYEPRTGGRPDAENEIFLKDTLAVLGDLPSDYGDILTMRYVNDMDITEIAEVLHISPNNVSVKLNRATKALKEKMHYAD